MFPSKSVYFPVVLIVVSVSGPAKAAAKVPVYKYIGGACVDSAGKGGLNPGYIGDCGDLHGANLVDRDFSAASFRGADLSDANLSRAKMSRVDFENAKLNGANLSKAKIGLAKFTRTDASGAKFDGASVISATASFSQFTGVTAKAADFSQSTFARCDFAQADFSLAILEQTTFSGTSFYATNFSGARLGMANLSSADLSFGVFAGAMIDGTNFSGAQLFQSDFSRATGKEPKFSSAIISEANFSSARLERPFFESTQIFGATLDSAEFRNGIFFSSIIRRSSLKSTVFDAGDFRRVRFEDTDLEKASFQNSDFRAAHLQPTGWAMATLSGAKFNSRTEHSFTAEELKTAGVVMIMKNSEIGILFDTKYVDVGDDTGSEASNLAKLIGPDLAVKTTEYSSDQIMKDLDTVGTYIVPELENERLNLSPAEIVAFQTFLEGGGNLILLSTADALIGSITGKPPLSQFASGKFKLAETTASDLGLRGLAPELTGYSATESFQVSSLPVDSRVLYGAISGGVYTVAAAYVFPYGKGKVWYLGWDFYGYTEGDAGMKNWGKLFSQVQEYATSTR